MGGFFSKLCGGKDARILMLGLDNAAKTSMESFLRFNILYNVLFFELRNYLFLEILYRMKLTTQVTTLPTAGCNGETVKFKNYAFNIWVLV